MWRGQPARTVAIGTAVVVFIVCSVVPVGYLLFTSVAPSRAYETVLLDARQRGLLYNTALLGTGTTLLAAAIGVPLGIALARVTLRGKALIRLVLAAPALLPPYVVGLAWVYMGLLSEWTYSLPIAILV